jgi:hypothetical protein
MDWKKLDTRGGAETGCSVTIVDLAGQPTDIVIRVRGSDSQAYRDKMRELRRSQDTEDAKAVEICAACTIDWSGMLEDGEAVSFTEAKALHIYASCPTIGEQVLKAIFDRANFITVAASN